MTFPVLSRWYPQGRCGCPALPRSGRDAENLASDFYQIIRNSRLKSNDISWPSPQSKDSHTIIIAVIVNLTDTTSLGLAAAPRLLNLLSPDERLLERMKDLVSVNAFLNVEPFRRLVEETIKPSVIRRSAKVLKVTATGWLTGDAHEFSFPKM